MLPVGAPRSRPGGAVTLLLAGDVMTGRGVDQIMRHPSRPNLYEPSVTDAREYVALAEATSGAVPRDVDAAYVWGDALAELDRASPDARIVNLETSVTRSEDAWPEKGIHYRMSPAHVDCLVAARLDVCVLANNHVLDWGRPGLVETLETLARAALATAGAGKTRAEAETPVVVAPRGGSRRVVVVAAAHGSSGVPRAWSAGEDRPGVALLDELSPAAATALAERARRVARPGDVVVASIHWGSNWGYEIPEAHARFAHALVDAGVDVVHGHSSHHPRAFERYQGKLVLYGCGDLLNDYEGIAHEYPGRGDLVLAYLARIGAGGAIESLVMLPFRLHKLRLERARPEDAAWLSRTLSDACAPWGARAAVDADGKLVARFEPSA